MKSKLPATPMETLSISGVLRAIIKIIHSSADVFRFWKYPSKNAAGDFEEMTLMDKMYWGYKSKHPIIHAEKHSPTETLLKTNRSSPPLPAGFEKTHTVTFSAVGDLIKVEGLENSKDTMYEDVADLIFDKDISYANLESQLTGQDIGAYTFSEKETPPLCCTEEEYDALKGHKGKRFTVMHTACNHTFDMGLEGLETTLEQLEADNILDLGTNRAPADRRKGRIIEKNGIKIGFVSATYGLNGKKVPEGKDYMVNVVKFFNKKEPGTDLTLLKDQISYCKARGCDIIIASLHWGYEYEFFPRQKQVKAARELVGEGVDVVVSHHPHVLQPMEFYRPPGDAGDAGDTGNVERTAVIAYSLGNLTSSYSAPHLVLSAILNLTVAKGTLNGRETTLVENAELIPVVQRDMMKAGLPVIRIERLETFSAGVGKTEEEQEYISAVKRYADLILG